MDVLKARKNWHIVVEKGALADLATIQHGVARQDLKNKILSKLGYDPLHTGEPLQGVSSHMRRLLTGYFRVVYVVDDKNHQVHILAIRRCFDAAEEDGETNFRSASSK